MFNARLINDPFGDPGVCVEVRHKREIILFDLGNLQDLMPRSLLKISRIFVSHTHMDHFIGFDHILRTCLGRDMQLHLFGPPGFIRNVECKLGAYTWNLVENYTNNFVLYVTEICPDGRETRRYSCREAFRPQGVEKKREQFDGRVTDDDYYSVRGIFLDHKIPCLAYALEEKRRVNIKKNVLAELAMPVGSWITELKNCIYRNEPDSYLVRVWWKDENDRVVERTYRLGDLKEQIVKITEGRKITYISDAVYSIENARKIVDLARDSEHVFIEACFLHGEEDRARMKYHLTALQAGRLAREAKAKRLTVFHFSPKYKGMGQLLIDEAIREFQG
jgi:ribonuclease Z